jgi:Lrp/AsnC family transcriptional regulator, leucine-responsive regulatory protein
LSTAIDTLDERILAELQANGRLTMKALAERVGLSSPAMIERVRRLEERGVIAGYRAVVAPGALGRPLTALILAQVQHADYGSFLETVSSEPSVAECHRITGEATFLVKVHVADTAALEQFVDALSAAGARCETSLVLSSPVPWRQITPPEGAAGARTRLPRRRRRTGAESAAEEAAPPAAPKGRGRGRRRTTP